MAKAYSEDLRIRIVKAYEQGLGSIRQLAQQFQVGKTFVCDLLKTWRSTGDVSPLPHGGGRPSKLGKEHLAKLQEIVAKNNDATLEELSELLEKESGLKVSSSTICRALQKLGLTYKKKLSMTLSRSLTK